MKQVLIFCLLCVLLPRVHAANITCASCDLGDTKCTGKTCTGEGCVILTESNALDANVSTTRTYKGCIKPNECKPHAFTLTTATGRKVQSSLACCSSEKCNEQLSISVPPVGTLENGVNCPACENYNQSQCVSKSHIACTGIEQKCITLEGISIVDQNQNFSIRGCASQNGCNLGANELVAYSGKIYRLSKKATCTDGGTLAAIASPLTLVSAVVGYLLANNLS